MSKDSEVDMKDVELNELDPEKQPMTGDGQTVGGEKNGSVKVKVPEEDVTFTGLSKEELMKVAGTPGWVRTRWVLLILFWLGWVGMLAGAIVIIVQAPRCKPIPEMNWWNMGPLYQISDLEAFSNGLAGVENKLDNVNQLKVKGLVLGPIHTVQADKPNTLDLKRIDPTQGSEKDLLAVLEKAHKKGISVVLDLTPNYLGASPWFSDSVLNDVVNDVQAAAKHWLSLGVNGIKISGLASASNALDWSSLQGTVQGNDTEDAKKLLMGVAEGVSVTEVSQLVNGSSADLVLSDLLSTRSKGGERINALDTLHLQQRSLAWGLGAAQRDQLSKRAASQALIRLYQLLLFTMPGTPVFNYGDEIGLQMQGDESPKMVWNIEKEPEEGAAVNETSEAERKEYIAVRKWFKSLSDLRGKERSLLHGDYYSLQSSATSLSFLRLWDQSDRFITAVNWGYAPETLELKLPPTEGVELPESALVKVSTDPELEVDSKVPLDKITVGPGQGVLLHFPYTG
ncbi:solute carrier family 3 member 2a [Dunckerocampus dactyliophorus]|uniref:solute carrier family 3 member 2a n=1 Tax=Dunckerocampus dactyliophorus TaxID=161453 RepID=UPI0024057F7D|nr:solute carrier family 3 member 2a [Dunckerocampus dactyliophorus]XP_054608409.1 solute carrier family 3 member 2a [Dunckerocampus dactyliophorus]